MRGEITEFVALATFAALLLSGGWMWLRAKLRKPDLLMMREETGLESYVPEGIVGTARKLGGEGVHRTIPTRHADTRHDLHDGGGISTILVGNLPSRMGKTPNV
jgi:hypothetical protein